MNSLVNKLRLGNTEPFGPFWKIHMANTEETPVYKVALRIMWFRVIIFSPGAPT